MERIKEAIAKAREQEFPPSRTHRRQGSASRDPGTTSLGETGEIVYRETRVVKLEQQHLEANRIVAHNKNDLRGSSYNLLRTQIVRKMRDNGWRTLAVVSPTAGSGKTVVSINLALSISQQADQTALLADLDLRKPKIATYLGITPTTSLGDVLEAKADLSEAMVNPGIPRLVVLPNSRSLPNASALLMGSHVQGLVTELRDRYRSRLVIFDLPPLLATDDALAFMPYVDCVLMVVADGMTTASELEASVRLLNATPLIGTVLNKSNTHNSSYY